jgi:hypothetical protein
MSRRKPDSRNDSRPSWAAGSRIASFRPTLSHLRIAIDEDDPRRFKALFNRRGASWDWDEINDHVDHEGNTLLISLCKKGWADCVQLLQNAPNSDLDPNVLHPKEKITAVQVRYSTHNAVQDI